MKTTRTQTIKRIADFLFPRICIGCGRINPKGKFNLICPDCAKNIAFCTGGKCTVCGEILGANNMPNIEGCPMCAELNIAFKSALCPTVFDGIIKTLIHKLKYEKANYAAKDLARIALLHPQTKTFLKDAIIVPVPIGKLRELARGYNQAEVLAREIQAQAPDLNIEIRHILKRIRNTSTQTKLDRQARIKNMKNAFALSKKSLPEKESKIIILDDVITTTATVNECAKVLTKVGYKNIFAFSIAKRV